jgi:L-asparaginase/Glu-tRNA(Gln) amidotransferase subunit D
MDIEYIRKVQDWVECDNKILKSKDSIKEIVEKKKKLEEEIIQYVEDNKYDKLTLNITDGNIKFSKRNTTQPLSMKVLRTLLEKYSTSEENIDVVAIMKYISESLETKQKVHMSREIKRNQEVEDI